MAEFAFYTLELSMAFSFVAAGLYMLARAAEVCGREY